MDLREPVRLLVTGEVVRASVERCNSQNAPLRVRRPMAARTRGTEIGLTDDFDVTRPSKESCMHA